MTEKPSIDLNPKAHLFLTSLPGGYFKKDGKFLTEGFYQTNEFIYLVTKLWKKDSKILFITASPKNTRWSKIIIDIISQSLNFANLSFESFDLCDDNDYNQDLGEYDVIFLGGGHVPTQNKFFEKIDLAQRIKDFEGIIIGVSAGSMNSAEIVYAQPEEKGEAVDPNYKRFLKGLNLTKYQIIPHYHAIKNKSLDGLRIIEDISYGDSVGRCFYALPNGSYIYQTKEEAYLYGEGFKIEDKKIDKLCENGNKLKLY